MGNSWWRNNAKVYKLNIEGMTVNFPDKLKVLIEGE